MRPVPTPTPASSEPRSVMVLLHDAGGNLDATATDSVHSGGSHQHAASHPRCSKNGRSLAANRRPFAAAGLRTLDTSAGTLFVRHRQHSAVSPSLIRPL